VPKIPVPGTRYGDTRCNTVIQPILYTITKLLLGRNQSITLERFEKIDSKRYRCTRINQVLTSLEVFLKSEKCRCFVVATSSLRDLLTR
jgi:hypothetical protein